MSDIPEQIDNIRVRAQRATPGPWQWFGDTSLQSVYLGTQHWGRHMIMGFERWGMRHATPFFFGGRTVTTDEHGCKGIDVRGGRKQSPKTDAIYEVARDATTSEDPRLYRHDLVGIRNADANFIAHSREDIDTLLKLVAGLEAKVASGVELQIGETVETVRPVGWFCEHRYGTPNADNHMTWDHKTKKLKRDKSVNGALSGFSGWDKDDSHQCPQARRVFIATQLSELALS